MVTCSATDADRELYRGEHLWQVQHKAPEALTAHTVPCLLVRRTQPWPPVGEQDDGRVDLVNRH